MRPPLPAPRGLRRLAGAGRQREPRPEPAAQPRHRVGARATTRTGTSPCAPCTCAAARPPWCPSTGRRRSRRRAGAGRRRPPRRPDAAVPAPTIASMAPAHASAPSDLRTETSRDPSGDGAQQPPALKTWNGSMKPATSARGMEEAPLTYCASPSVPRRTRSTRARSKRDPTWATAAPEVAGRLAHAAQPHRLAPAPALLAGVGDHGLHLGHRAPRMRTHVPSASTSTSSAAESARGATPSRNRSRARAPPDPGYGCV